MLAQGRAKVGMVSPSDLQAWPSHRWWGGVDGVEGELSACDSHSATCKCNLPGSEACQGLPFCALDHAHKVHTRCGTA